MLSKISVLTRVLQWFIPVSVVHLEVWSTVSSTPKSHLLRRAKCIRRPLRVVKWQRRSGATRRSAGEVKLNCFKAPPSLPWTKTKAETGWRSHLQPWNLAARGRSVIWSPSWFSATSRTLAHTNNKRRLKGRTRGDATLAGWTGSAWVKTADGPERWQEAADRWPDAGCFLNPQPWKRSIDCSAVGGDHKQQLHRENHRAGPGFVGAITHWVNLRAPQRPLGSVASGKNSLKKKLIWFESQIPKKGFKSKSTKYSVKWKYWFNLNSTGSEMYFS